MPTRPIEDVLADHAEELMKIEGVAGVYQSVLEDGMPCIKVAVVGRTPEVERGIPEDLEGHPVVIVVTGRIGPRAQSGG